MTLLGVNQRSTTEKKTFEFLFYFVSIAYGMSITDVFPVLYSILRYAYRQWELLPAIKGPLLLSARYWTLIAPHVDKACLAFLVFTLWIAYYFLIAGLRACHDGNYGLRYLVVDVIQALLFYCTSQSLQNLDEKGFVHQDTSWTGLCLILGVQFFRTVLGVFPVAYPSSRIEAVRFRNCARIVFPMARLTALVLAIAVLGWKYDWDGINIAPILGAMALGLRVYVGLLCVIALTIAGARLFCAAPAEKAPWDWVWQDERPKLLIRAVIGLALLLSMYVSRDALFPMLLGRRNLVPWALPCLAVVIVGLLFVSLRRVIPLLRGSEFSRLVDSLLHTVHEYVIGIYREEVTVVVVSVEDHPRVLSYAGDLRKLERESILEVVSGLCRTPQQLFLRGDLNPVGNGVDGVPAISGLTPQEELASKRLGEFLAIVAMVPPAGAEPRGVLFTLSRQGGSALFRDERGRRLLMSTAREISNWYAEQGAEWQGERSASSSPGDAPGGPAGALSV